MSSSGTHAQIIRWVAGEPPTEYPTEYSRINSLWGALLWRLASLPGLDADVRADGSVYIWRAK